jgi:hypothetical protein
MDSHKVRDDDMESMDLSVKSRTFSFQAFSEISCIFCFCDYGKDRGN